MLLLGDPLPAPRMAELGLISQRVPAEQLEAAADDGDRSARRQRAAVAEGHEGADGARDEFRDGIEHDDVDALVAGRDAAPTPRKAWPRMLERRAPRFQGR